MAISPESQEWLAQAVRNAYADMEQLILQKIAARLATGMDRPDWMEKKRLELRNQRAAVEIEIRKMQGKLPEYLKDAIDKSYKAGKKSADDDLTKFLGVDFTENVLDTFGAIHTHAVEALVAETLGLMQGANLQILRSADDIYRDVISQVAQGTLTGTETRRQTTQRALNKWADKGVGAFVDSRGRTWGADTYGEMATRTAVGNAAVKGHLNRMQEQGRDLVIVSDHKEECARCRPWERRVLSISGKTPGYPTVAAARAGGLWHPNCGHTINAYIPGLTLDVETPDSDPEGYKLREQQRYLERQIRFWKKRQAVALDHDQLEKAGAKVKEWSAAMKDFVDSNDRLRQKAREQLRFGKKDIEKQFKELPYIIPEAAAKPKRKPPTKKPKPPADDAYVKQVKDQLAKGVMNEVEARAVGGILRQQIEAKIASNKAVISEVEQLRLENQSLSAQYTDIKNKVKAAQGDDWVRLKAVEKEIYDKWSETHKQLTAKQGELKDIRTAAARETLSAIRRLGVDQPQAWAPGSRQDAKEAFNLVTKYLPTEWLNLSAPRQMKAKKVQRGYYSGGYGSHDDYALSGSSAEGMQRVAIHEMGHRFEHMVPGIKQLEYEFYQRRTAGEKLAHMGSGYSRDEKTRRDHFLSPYMGKDYGNTEKSYYELLSMGLESIFYGSYDLTKDLDFYDFILGVMVSR